jgi:hypothetical protein
LTALGALAAGTGFAAQPALQGSPSQGQTDLAPAAVAQGLPKVCLDVQSSDELIEEFAVRVRETISASGVLSLGSSADSCSLRLHIPGNLLRFQTAGGVMVSTVAIVTSQSGRYLSTSIAACHATDLKPCAVRAVAAAKLALVMRADDGT